MIINLSDMVNGEIRILSDALCVARAEDELFGFARYCPHAGADLSVGYVEHQHIRCCWHNLAIDLRTGLSQCKSIAPLRVFFLRHVGGGTYEIITTKPDPASS